MDRFCCASAAIHRWKFDPWGFFALTRVAPIHRASFCIQPHLSGSERFFVFSSWAIETVFTWRSDSTIFYRHFRQLAFQSVVHLWHQNYRNGIETKITRDWPLQYQDHKHYSHFQPPLRFRLFRRKTVKYGVFSLCWCPSLTRTQTILSQAITKLSEKFF